MKINIKEISASLEVLRAAIRKTERARTRLTETQADAPALEKAIAEIGEPSYSDAKAIQELTALEKQLELCQNQIPGIEQALRDAADELVVVANEVSSIAQGLLAPILANRLDTLMAVFGPFSDSPASARRVAQQTDCWRAGQTGMVLVAPQHQLFQSNPAGLLEAARRVEAVLAEGSKKSPDLMQFLSAASTPVEPPPAGGTSEEKPASAAAAADSPPGSS